MRCSVVTAALMPLLVAASPVLLDSTNEAPIITTSNAKEVPNSYIVVFKDHVQHSSVSSHHEWIQKLHIDNQGKKMELRKRSQLPMMDDIYEGLKHTFHIPGKLLGYSGHFDDKTIQEVRKHPDVAWIEKDSEVYILPHATKEPTIENSAPWGLARISHRESLTFGTFNKYLYSSDGGSGVDVYVIDTGINVEHVDFEGRASWGKTIPANDEDVDGNGHGTHCSGTVGGKRFGVAKKANVIAVKVLKSNGSGTMADVVKGVEFAAQSHTEKVEQVKAKKDKTFKGSAANMSLGGVKKRTLQIKKKKKVEAGIHIAETAANDNADSCNYSPAAADKAVTVGASTLADERAFFSNYGKCNDIFAPGLNILSTWIGSKHATNTISGTSMASPHIAGLLAYFLSLQPSEDSAYAVAAITPKKLKAELIAMATKDVLTDVPSSTANILAWNGGGIANYTEIVRNAAQS